MNSSGRDKLIEFERFTATENDYGEEIEAWAPAFKRWAQVWMGKGSERREAAMEQGSQAATFGLLMDSDTRAITLKDRLIYAGSVWDIEGIAPDTPQRGEMEITATRGEAFVAAPVAGSRLAFDAAKNSALIALLFDDELALSEEASEPGQFDFSQSANSGLIAALAA